MKDMFEKYAKKFTKEEIWFLGAVKYGINGDVEKFMKNRTNDTSRNPDDDIPLFGTAFLIGAVHDNDALIDYLATYYDIDKIQKFLSPSPKVNAQKKPRF